MWSKIWICQKCFKQTLLIISIFLLPGYPFWQPAQLLGNHWNTLSHISEYTPPPREWRPYSGHPCSAWNRARRDLRWCCPTAYAYCCRGYRRCWAGTRRMHLCGLWLIRGICSGLPRLYFCAAIRWCGHPLPDTDGWVRWIYIWLLIGWGHVWAPINPIRNSLGKGRSRSFKNPGRKRTTRYFRLARI